MSYLVEYHCVDGNNDEEREFPDLQQATFFARQVRADGGWADIYDMEDDCQLHDEESPVP